MKIYMRDIFRFSLLAFLSVSPLWVHSQQELGPVKAWYDEKVTRSAVPAGEPMEEGRGTELFERDTVKKLSGDYSIRVRFPEGARHAMKVGFLPFPSVSWNLNPSAVGRFWVSAETAGNEAIEGLEAGVATASGETFAQPLSSREGRRGEWMEVAIPLSDFRVPESGGTLEITEIFVIVDAPAGVTLWLDDVRFEEKSSGTRVGVTDKPIDVRQKDARRSREMRTIRLYEDIFAGMDRDRPTHEQLFAGLWLGKDLEWLNTEIQKHLLGEREDLGGHRAFAFPWSLFAAPWLARTYLTFGSSGNGPSNNRLSEETERLILEKLWNLTKSKNDIHWARHRNPWWMDGSENHDLNGVVYNYLSSMIFMDHPDYRERVFPNVGRGGGPGYWFHMHGAEYFYGPYGIADLADGLDYRAEEHFEAWGKVLHNIVKERLRRGIFLEHASPGYMNYTLSYLKDVYHFSPDLRLRDLMKNFFDVIWAEWALETLNGFRGGAKTRDHTVVDVRGDSMYQIGKFFFGGLVDHNLQRFYWLGLSDYRLPDFAWRIAFDRESKGDFAFISRAIGEEPTDIPREPGLERTLNLNTEHRMFRYSWITPHYVLGSQHDHPFAVHSHLSPASRSYGLNFSTHPDARIFPYGVTRNERDDWELLRRGGIMYRAVQSEHVLISQQSRGYERREPAWFPRRSTAPIPMGVYFSPRLETVVERDGWIFVHEGNAYAAVRIVEAVHSAGDGISETVSFLDYAANSAFLEDLRTNNYHWNHDRTIAVAENALSAVIIDTSHAGRHAGFDVFMEAVLNAELSLLKTVVPGWFVLHYRGSGEGASLLELNLANNEAPMIDGRVVDYDRALLFDSPFMRSVYGSGVIEFRDDGFFQSIKVGE